MYSIRITHDKSLTVRLVDARVKQPGRGSGTGAPVTASIPVNDGDEWPGRLRIVSFKIEDYVLAALDKLAEQLGTSRSELIRLGVAVILAIFNNGEARRLLEQLRELEERVNSIEEDLEWLKGVVHDHVGPF